jgi:uncharacterized protein YacL (UPF0231 family)
MKLFRDIRQALINQGSFKRYLFYAIGEILLVMIGISLAFQVNNWNDNRIKKNTEISYYENIRDQILDDKTLIYSQLEFNNYYKARFNYVNEIIETNDRSKIDTIGPMVRELTQYSDFDRQGNIYETLVNSGEIKLLRNHKIINGIRQLEEKYMYMNRMENIHYDVIMNHVSSIMSPIIKYSNSEIKKPDDLFSYEFQNIVQFLMQIMTEKDKVYNEALDEIERVNDLIDEELESAN